MFYGTILLIIGTALFAGLIWENIKDLVKR
jgi:hypothetical protein